MAEIFVVVSNETKTVRLSDDTFAIKLPGFPDDALLFNTYDEVEEFIHREDPDFIIMPKPDILLSGTKYWPVFLMSYRAPYTIFSFEYGEK